MEQRRVAFKLGVVYRTSYKLLQQLPTLLKSIVLEQQSVRFDKAHLQEYGNYSINFEIVYFITDPDYNLFMDTHQAVLFRIHEEFSKLGIEFAMPTQTLFIGGFQEEQNAKNREPVFKEPTEKTPSNR